MAPRPPPSFRYRAYGQISQSTIGGPTYLGLASQLIDPSGFYYMCARWYDPATGRFISRDPMRGDPAPPSSLNAFGYAAADPIVVADPSGLCVTIGVGAVIGGVTDWITYQVACQQSSAGCTVAGAAGAAAAGALTGALIGLAGPAAGTIVAGAGITSAWSAAATATAALTLRAGIGGASYYVGGEVTNLTDAIQGRDLEFAPDGGDFLASSGGAAIAGGLVDWAIPLRGVNTLAQGVFTPQTLLSTGLNSDRMVANAFAGGVLEVLGTMASSLRSGDTPDEHWDGLYFTQ